MRCDPPLDAIQTIYSVQTELCIKTAITVRFEQELLADLREHARKENRTLTNFIETVLRQRLVEAASNASLIPIAPRPRSTKRTKDKPTHAA